ncbi:hypothetical protein [Chitinolyticbacter meiyuanensis]|uniref:hypothetical protein n=1 Tax=Chitinolyticbacter meiyuanensis TaxID=682798 RepID=UPI0011E59EE1|nr:hypothetical protein [Chitinolyticbacter meiyuanensis]
MPEKSKFHVIAGTPPPATQLEEVRKIVRAMPKPASMLQCHRCGGREIMETKIGALLKNGKVSGGTKQYLCASCFLKGERVLLK